MRRTRGITLGRCVLEVVTDLWDWTLGVGVSGIPGQDAAARPWTTGAARLAGYIRFHIEIGPVELSLTVWGRGSEDA